ncbi:hypothetical protein [Mycoplasma putrefaciens]|uniref:Uncharacterized protein n=1 Tax=Mycoplasma putrefaciens (strain ATCC 15718 / NCTC 10155 / C30 KS-1 / KS-1) TaxID=743965 RepID=A0A7U3ZT36_MYCPK|nr:hypothetical protein [Mycoplasma putrefaciens]AEM68979.1 uncharacterized protein MPUT_0639 [Mycoplasma putrefaciens KS1]
MKLTTWTFYKADHFQSLSKDEVLTRTIPVLILRPDATQEKTLLCLALTQKIVNSIIIDLQNKVFSSDELLEIFKDNIGFTSTENLTEIDAKGINLSTSIHPENIKNLVQTYNLFLNKQPITFDTKDYQTMDLIKQQTEIFIDVDLENMQLSALLQTLNIGMQNYRERLEQLSKLKEDELLENKEQLFNLQANLISFFDQAVRKMDQFISQLSEQNAELIKQLESEQKA